MRIITRSEETKLNSDFVELKVEVVSLKAQLEAEVNRRERAELELNRLQDDFKGLVALTAGRIPPKMAPEFTKDLWKEDERLPETFLTPSDAEMYGEEAEETQTQNGN